MAELISCLTCIACGDVLRVDAKLRVEELKNALSGFMAEHYQKHGPEKTYFYVPEECDGDLMAMPKELRARVN